MIPFGDTEADHRCLVCGQYEGRCVCPPDQQAEAEAEHREEREREWTRR